MSNDKMAATLHGSCACPYWCERHPGLYAINEQARRNRETTGEHTKAKLADYLYEGVHPRDPQLGMISGREASENSAWAISQLGSQFAAVPGAPADLQPKGQNQYLASMSRCICLRAPGDPDELRKNDPGKHHAPTCNLYRRPARRSWAPSEWQLVAATGIALAILAVAAWVFLLLG